MNSQAALPITDIPPEPDTNQKAIKEINRLQDISQGLYRLWLGIFCIFIVLCCYQPWRPIYEKVAYFLFFLIGLLIQIYLPKFIKASRKHHGIPIAPTYRHTHMSKKTFWLRVVTIPLTIAMILYFSFEKWGPKIEDPKPFLLFASAVFAFPMAVRGFQLKLWEHYTTYLGFVLGCGFMIYSLDLRGHKEDIGFDLKGLFLNLGISQLIAGYSLNQRWKVWVKSYPIDSTPSVSINLKNNGKEKV